MNNFNYTGDQTELSEPYLPSQDLIDAVNVSIALERPLLLKGEPGCGKTRLAKAVAEELNLAYFEWPIKSTSRAIDGLYTYDNVGRLRDAQLSKSNPRAKVKFDDPENYIRWGPIGRAFQKKFFDGKERAVLLIDEIDKADIDFPNDLLHELDLKEFTVEEIYPSKKIEAESSPIIFITSNDEKPHRHSSQGRSISENAVQIFPESLIH